jgi:hypothetical protein
MATALGTLTLELYIAIKEAAGCIALRPTGVTHAFGDVELLRRTSSR